MNWWKDLKKIFNGVKGKIRFEEPLKNKTTFKIGGRAKFFIEPKDTADLKLLLGIAKRYKLPIFIMGNGSNILVSDKGLRGIVLQLNSPYFKSIFKKNNLLFVGGGLLIRELIQEAKKRSLSGIEFMSGIPGRVGGALIMNAGISAKVDKNINIGDLVENVTVMDYNGNIKTLNKKDIKFGYRKSNLSRYIILGAGLRLIKKDKKEIKNIIDRYLNQRRLTQDLSKPSAGCIFKNPKGFSAGRLIDLCGLKGKSMGDAYVSKRHANFILNQGKAKATDVLKLMDLIRENVKRKFNISLEAEIKIWQ